MVKYLSCLLALVTVLTLAAASYGLPSEKGAAVSAAEGKPLSLLLSLIAQARRSVLRIIGLAKQDKGLAASGYYHLKSPVFSASSATTKEDRERLGLRGLLPAGEPIPLDVQVETVMKQLSKLDKDIHKYSYLQTIHDNAERVYYATLMKHTAECMPLVYTPTVGQACQEWHELYRHTPRGIYLSLEDLGKVKEALSNWPLDDIRVIVVTDGERILGLGDLGVNGMGIPVGKLALYTACAGIAPEWCLPVHIDVGTENKDLRSDPAYMGLKQPRDRSDKYDQLITEFMGAVQSRYGKNTLIQFEDFGNANAFRLMHYWERKACTFNDDIQGTAAVALAGLIASEKLTDLKLQDHTFLFYGAGEAGAGIADLIVNYVVQTTGKTAEEARKKVFMMDSKGLVTLSRISTLQHHKIPFAQDVAEGCKSLDACVDLLKPTALIGVAAVGAAFTEAIVRKMGELNKSPVIFALSNPTSKAECSAKQAYEWTEGRAVFASGSPFPPAEVNGKTLVPGQGNNAYIFPGLGLATIAAGAKHVGDSALIVAAKALADQVEKESLDQGTLYPPLGRIREVSAGIAVEVAKHIYEVGDGTGKMPLDMKSHVESIMWHPQ